MMDAAVIVVLGLIFIVASNRHKRLLSGQESIHMFLRAEWQWLLLWLGVAVVAGLMAGPDLQDKGFGN